jgi:hypothetical protein
MLVLVEECTIPFLIGDGGLRLEEPVELAVVEESLPFLTTLAWEAATEAESFEARSFLEAERVGACFFDIIWAKEVGLFLCWLSFQRSRG